MLTVVSLLTDREEVELELQNEESAAARNQMQFISLPIEDRGVPASAAKTAAVIEKLDAELDAGRNVLIHCRQGIGRSALLAACLLIDRGAEPKAALEAIAKARGREVPETAEQRQWIQRYAAAVAGRG
jgi:protein-tyrosine phosphatase